MTKEQLETLINHLSDDITTIREDNYHPRQLDLIRMVIGEDIPEVIKFLERLVIILDANPKSDGSYYNDGFIAGINKLKGQICES